MTRLPGESSQKCERVYNADHDDVQLAIAGNDFVQQDRARDEEILGAGLFPAGSARAGVRNILGCDEGDRRGSVLGIVAKHSEDPGKVPLICQSDDGRNEQLPGENYRRSRDDNPS